MTDPGDPSFEERLERHRRFDVHLNEETRPPESEVITLHSVTIAEMYVSQDVDKLVSELRSLHWDEGAGVADSVAEALKGDLFSGGRFWIYNISASQASGLGGSAYAPMPEETERIFASYEVLGPSLAAMVFTFVLSTSDSMKLDAALREDAQSTLTPVGGGMLRYERVREAKKARLRKVRSDLEDRYRTWISAHFQGSLCSTDKGVGLPSALLISLEDGLPFETHAQYMTLLDLYNSALAMRLAEYNSVFLTYPLDASPNNRTVAAFNRSKAEGENWLPGLGEPPETFHETYSAALVADGVRAVLTSYFRKLRGVRHALVRINLNSASSGDALVKLRDQLIDSSRDISAVTGDVEVLLDDPFAIWTEIPDLVSVAAAGSPTQVISSVDSKKRDLAANISELRKDEANLRQLVLVSSESASEKSGHSIQQGLLVLTQKLNTLTSLLLVLTVVLVVLGVAALLVQWFHEPSVMVHTPSEHLRSGHLPVTPGTAGGQTTTTSSSLVK